MFLLYKTIGPQGHNLNKMWRGSLDDVTYVISNSMPSGFRQFVCLFVCLFVLLFYVPSQQLWSWWEVSSTNHTFSWASLNKQLTSTSCTYSRL